MRSALTDSPVASFTTRPLRATQHATGLMVEVALLLPSRGLLSSQQQLRWTHTLGIGTRLQHTQYGPGVIVGVRYATYLICFINHGTKEIDKTDAHLDEIIPENVTVEVETVSATEKSLLKILRLWGNMTEVVPLGEKWIGGTLFLQPADKSLKPKEIPMADFFHKIVMLRDRLRVLERNINSNKKTE
jgi:hypothetical protein